MRRHIRVHFDDGDTIETEINGSESDICRYYVGQVFERTETVLHTAVRVEFLDVKNYRAKFVGRETGAIGICYPIETDVSGFSRDNAILNLYERFEHLRDISLAEA